MGLGPQSRAKTRAEAGQTNHHEEAPPASGGTAGSVDAAGRPGATTRGDGVPRGMPADPGHHDQAPPRIATAAR